MNVHCVNRLPFEVYPLVWEYNLLPLANQGQVVFMRNVLERCLSNTFAHLICRDLRLGVTDDSIADLDKVHFGFKFYKLDDRFAFRFVL